MKFRKLSEGFGVEVEAADLARLSEREFQDLENAFFAGQVLVARKQKLSPGQFLSFAKRLGRPEPHVIDQFHPPQPADILILSNVGKDGNPTGSADART